MLKHGTETLVKDYGRNTIVKTPLARTASKRQDWITHQRSAADTMQKLSEIGNSAYVIPKTEMIDSENFRVIEERIDGMPLTPLMFRALDEKKRDSIVDALANFYADIHRIHPVENPVKYQMQYGFRLEYLTDFTKTGMRKWFPMSDVNFVRKTCCDLSEKEYESRLAWAHNDIFEENVLYNARTNKCAIIDFTKAGYSFLHYDLVDSYVDEMGIFDKFRARYLNCRSGDNLPDSLTNPEKWNKILQYHRAAQIISDMDENALDIQIGLDTNTAVSQMRTNVEKLRHSWSR